MVKEEFKKEIEEITFPEESGLIIEKILEKYGLVKVQEDGIERIIKSDTPQEKTEIFKNLPGTKISTLIKECAEKKISLEDMSQRLEKELNIPEKEAKKIVDELEKKILIFIENVEEKKLPPSEVSVPKTELPEKPEITQKKDTYREQIE